MAAAGLAPASSNARQARLWYWQRISAMVLFLCVLPSTVQSSIAFTSIAKGNVPAAICAASTSNILGIFLTPALVALLFSAG